MGKQRTEPQDRAMQYLVQLPKGNAARHPLSSSASSGDQGSPLHQGSNLRCGGRSPLAFAHVQEMDRDDSNGRQPPHGLRAGRVRARFSDPGGRFRSLLSDVRVLSSRFGPGSAVGRPSFRCTLAGRSEGDLGTRPKLCEPGSIGMGLLKDLERADATETGRDLHRFAAELFPICRSITGNGIRQTLARVQDFIPLRMTEVPTGTAVFDWTIPKEWNIR